MDEQVMDTASAVSIVRSEIAKRNALVYFDEILTKVLESEEKVAAAEKFLASNQARLNEDIERHRVAVINAQEQLASVQAVHDERAAQVELLQKDLGNLKEQITDATAELNKITSAIQSLKAQFA